MTIDPSSPNPAILTRNTASGQQTLVQRIIRDFPKQPYAAIRADIAVRVGILVLISSILLANRHGLLWVDFKPDPILVTFSYLGAAWIGAGKYFEIAKAATQKPLWKFVLFSSLAYAFLRHFAPDLLPSGLSRLATSATVILLVSYTVWGAISLVNDVASTQTSRQIKAYLKTLPRSERNARKRQIRLQMITQTSLKSL